MVTADTEVQQRVQEQPVHAQPVQEQVVADAKVAPAVASSRKKKPPEKEHRIQGQPAFVLHSYPHKETSLIVDLLTRDHGRVAVVAKGAKRPYSKLRGVLQTFQPLSVSYSGKSEVRTLTGAEWIGGLLPLEKSALFSGFYLNELLLKLTVRDDPHPFLFDHYVAALNRIAHGSPPAIVLRQFELSLLKETGVAGSWMAESSGERVVSGRMYVVDPQQGVRLARAAEPGMQVSGKTLLDMENDDYADPVTQQQSKLLMRYLLSHHLGGTPMNTRQILMDLMQL